MFQILPKSNEFLKFIIKYSYTQYQKTVKIVFGFDTGEKSIYTVHSFLNSTVSVRRIRTLMYPTHPFLGQISK